MSDGLKILLEVMAGAIVVLLFVSTLGGGGMMGGMGSMMSGGIIERFAMSLVHEPSWGDGCLFGRSQKEDSRGRGGAAHEQERGRSRFRGEPLLGQALREGGARRAFALAGEGSGQETHAR